MHRLRVPYGVNRSALAKNNSRAPPSLNRLKPGQQTHAGSIRFTPGSLSVLQIMLRLLHAVKADGLIGGGAIDERDRAIGGRQIR